MGRYGAGGAGAGVAMGTTILLSNFPMDLPMKGREDPTGPASSGRGARGNASIAFLR